MKTYTKKHIIERVGSVLKDNNESISIEVENTILPKIDIIFEPSFNCIYLDTTLQTESGMCRPFDGVSIGSKSDVVLGNIFRLLSLVKGSGVILSKIKDIACRAICVNGNVIALGHFLDDRFAYIDDILNMENSYE